MSTKAIKHFSKQAASWAAAPVNALPNGVKVAVAGGGVTFGALYGVGLYADHVKSATEWEHIPQKYKAAAGVTLVLLDSLSLISAIMTHRKFKGYLLSGGSLSMWQWIKAGMPKTFKP